jgi:predicted tellurium resistance membrane protein TerC
VAVAAPCIGAGCPDILQVLLVIFALTTIYYAVPYLINRRKRGKASSRMHAADKLSLENKTMSAREKAEREALRKFWSFFGVVPLLGILSGSLFVVGDVLYFSIVVPARTNSQISTTIALFVFGTIIAVVFLLIGFFRVARMTNELEAKYRSESETSSFWYI